MGENRFTVDPGALTAASESTCRASAILASVQEGFSRFHCEAFGHSKAVKATQTFTSHWKYQAGKLSDSLQESSHLLAAAASNYEAVEDASQKMVGGPDSGGGGGGGGW